MKELLTNSLPYIGVEPKYSQEELEMKGVAPINAPNYIGLKVSEAKTNAQKDKITIEIIGQGENIKSQFPPEGTIVNQNSKILLYTD